MACSTWSIVFWSSRIFAAVAILRIGGSATELPRCAMGLPAQINRRDSFQLAGRLDVQVLG